MRHELELAGKGYLFYDGVFAEFLILNVLTFTNSYMLQARKLSIATIAYELPRASKECNVRDALRCATLDMSVNVLQRSANILHHNV